MKVKETLSFNIVLSIVLLFIGGINSRASTMEKDTVRVGIQINNIYDIDLSSQSYKANFWIWFNYENDSLAFLDLIQISNAKEFQFHSSEVVKYNETNWAYEFCTATLINSFNINDFPFDKQQLIMEIEVSYDDTSKIYVIIDEKNTELNNKVDLYDWNISSFSTTRIVNSYNTNYGDPRIANGKTQFSALLCKIDLERNALGLFIKYFTGLYVAFFVAIASFFINSNQLEAKLSLGVGALFTSIGNKYIVDSTMPQSTQFTLVDRIHNWTFIYILLIIVVAIWTSKISKNKKGRVKNKAIHLGFYLFLATYIIINFIILY